MANANRVRVVILAEDALCARFAEAVLKSLGVGARERTLVPIRTGGSKKQSVTQEYAIQVRAMRKHAKVRRAALLVVTDADQQKVS